MRKDFKDLKKNCEYCGKEMRRKKFGNRYEDANVFLKRKYCDRECMRKGFLNVGKNNSSWSATHESARNINNLILNKNQCVAVSKASCATVAKCSVSETCNSAISLEIPGKNPMSCSSKLAQKSCSGKKDEIKCAGKIVQNSDAVQVVATK